MNTEICEGKIINTFPKAITINLKKNNMKIFYLSHMKYQYGSSYKEA